MPKISAATVAQHRAMKERQVVDAAVDLLTREGVSAVTPAAVAQRTGLARTSVYQYAGSADDLVGMAVEDLFVRVNDALARALQDCGPEPETRLETIIRTVLQGTVAGHTPEALVDMGAMGADHQARLHELHAELLAPLQAAVEAVGVADPVTATAITWGAINGVVPLVEHGMPVEHAVVAVVAYVRAGLAGGR